jgi:hypothetical protein
LADRLEPFRLTGNRARARIVGVDILSLVTYITAWPDVTSCQATFMENKHHTIANGLKKNAMKCKLIKTRESQREGSRSLFFDYIKNNLDNYSLREFQDVDSCSEFELVTDIATKTAIDASSYTAMQCNPHIMRGLQDIIPGCRMNIEMTPAGGGKKVCMSLQQIVPQEHPMKISAGNIVCLNIRAHVVAKVAEYVGGGANGM